MRIPLSWIKEYIHIESSPAEIARMLTMAGLEVDSYETAGSSFTGVVAAAVIAVEKHPDADKLVVAKVRLGQETFQVVCGAPNCRAGIVSAYAPVGATLDNGAFTIKKSKLRGVESNGMLCAADELQLGDEGEGIMELPLDTPEGKPLKELFSDTVFEISLTPNLGHCASILGIARELSAATGLPVIHPLITLTEGQEPTQKAVNVKVIDSEGCPRYTCRVIKNVKVGPSPEWLISRLEKCGLRSINNVVDVTNYVLMELGHPLHAFDLDRLEQQSIVVKRAQVGEAFKTLDNKERILKGTDLMIADAKRPVAIAGVMGGLNSEVHDGTINVALESAYFDPVSIRKTSKHLGLQSDSSKRFERGTDPNGLLTSLDRAAQMIQLVAGGDILKGVVDIKYKEFPPIHVACRLNRINKLLGIELSRGEVEEIFKRLGFGPKSEGQDLFHVQVPTYRVDISKEVDLIEEVARIYGYDNIPRVGGKHHSSAIPAVPIYVFEQEVRARLMAEGLQEFLTCDLVGPTILNIVQEKVPPETVVTVMNPTSVEQSVMRISLLPGLLQVVKYNVDHQNHDISGFEVGRIHFKEGNEYKEPYVAGILLSGKDAPHHWDIKPKEFDFYDLKGIVENLLAEFGVQGAAYKNLGIDTFHSGRQASIFVNDLEIGSIGEIHPDIQRRLDVPQRILFGEINLEDLMQVARRRDKITPLAIYPGSERDWTITIQESVPYADIMKALKARPRPLVEGFQLLDIYRSDKLPKGYQNLTFRFVYRDPSKTIDQETVEAEHQRLTGEIIKALGDAIKN